MRLADARYEEIKKIVVNLFERVNISCIPIDGFEISKKLGVILVPYRATKNPKRLKEINDDAICAEKDGKRFIFYNDDKSYERKNFTILHELGHLELGHTEHCPLAEAEANFFAKYAIAPPILIHKLRLGSYIEIQERFCISQSAAKNVWNYYLKWRNVDFLFEYDERLNDMFKL